MKGERALKRADIPQARFEEYVDGLIEFIERACGKNNGMRDGMCGEVTSQVKIFLEEKGFKCKIIEGEVKIGQNDHLVHRINLVTVGDDAWIIDFSSGQIPALKGTEWIIQKLPNGYNSVKAFLKEKYNWWFPE